MKDTVRILIVEHRYRDRMLARQLLEDYGVDFNWIRVGCSEELREVAASFDPTIVMCADDSGGWRDAALSTPYYGQTHDFTCGPCALLMAMAALDPTTPLDRAAEIRIWREATTVFMAAGHGGCGPHGLALAAERRGFRTTVHAPGGKAMFIDSVRDVRKKEVIQLVEADFRSELASTQARMVSASMTAAQLVDHLHQGRVPIVLISLWRLHGEKGPHWVVVTGFDGHVFRILDPMVAPAAGDPHMTITVDEFHRITRYGRRRQTAAVVLCKEN